MEGYDPLVDDERDLPLASEGDPFWG